MTLFQTLKKHQKTRVFRPLKKALFSTLRKTKNIKNILCTHIKHYRHTKTRHTYNTYLATTKNKLYITHTYIPCTPHYTIYTPTPPQKHTLINSSFGTRSGGHFGTQNSGRHIGTRNTIPYTIYTTMNTKNKL